MTIIVSGRLVESEAEARNQTAAALVNDGTQLGVIEGVQGGLTLSKTSGMGWQLDIGRAVIAPATAATGPVVATVTVAETGSFANGDATRDRIDVVTLQIDETATIANGNPRVHTAVVQGAYPASGPPVQPAIPAGAIGLAAVKISAGTSAAGGGWNTAQLTDIRGVFLGKLSRMEVTASNSIPNATSPLWGVGALTIDASTAPLRTTDSAFVNVATADKLTFPTAGEYSIHWLGRFTAQVTGRSFLSIEDPSGTGPYYARSNFAVGEDTTSVNVPNLIVTAGQTVRLSVYQTSGAALTLSSRVTIQRVQ
jgi:hypothetical protein